LNADLESGAEIYPYYQPDSDEIKANRGNDAEAPARLRKIQTKFRASVYGHARFSGWLGAGEKDAPSSEGCIHFARVIRPSRAMRAREQARAKKRQRERERERAPETSPPRLLHFGDELSSPSATRNSRPSVLRRIPEEARVPSARDGFAAAR